MQLQRFGLLPYGAGLRWQHEAAERVRAGGPDALALLQHTPVYTFGRRARPEHLLLPEDSLRARGAQVVEADRGGGVTFHGPGQLVGYPILDMRRRGLGPVDYVRKLEEVLVVTCHSFGVEAWRVQGRPGVWTARGKLGAIGVRVERGVSLHGFALNVDVDLSWFEAIVPCGIADASVTSLAKCPGASPGIEAVTDTLAREFASAFGVGLLEPGPGYDRAPAHGAPGRSALEVASGPSAVPAALPETMLNAR